MQTESEATRLDKWLWTARFFKTRKLPAVAISGGKVHVNSQRTKPGIDINSEALLSISKEGLRWDVTIIALSSQRRSAREAALLYEETAESLAKRQQQMIQQRELRKLFDFSDQDHKPNKKERRLIHRFKQV